jgi:hypothetical protein
MIYAITILYFGAMYAIKGGWLGMVPRVDALRESSKFWDRVLDGKVASTIGVYVYFAVVLSVYGGMVWYWDLLIAPAMCSVAWLISVTPSMGEEAGACGRIGHAWGDYIDKGFGRSYGIKKALQRGVWIGVPWTVITGLSHFLLLGLLFPVIHFAMQEFYYLVHKTDSWKYAEPVVGAICIGVGVAIYLSKMFSAALIYGTLEGAL